MRRSKPRKGSEDPAASAAPAPAPATAPGAGGASEARPHRRPRRRPVWVRITVLLVVPLASLVGLWAFAASLTLENALSRYEVQRTNEKIGQPGVLVSVHLQAERALSVAYLATGGRDRTQLAAQRARTDAAEVVFRRTALNADVREDAGPAIRARLDEVSGKLQRLRALRAEIDAGSVRRADALAGYNDIVGSTIRLFGGLVIIKDLDIFQAGRAMISLSWSREFAMRQDCLIIAAQTQGGRLTAVERGEFARWAGAGQQFFEAGLGDLSGGMAATLSDFSESSDYRRFRELEAAIIASGGRLAPAQTAEWTQLSQRLSPAWANSVNTASAALIKQAEPIGDRIAFQLVIAGGLGLIAVLVSIALSVLFGRGLGRELRELQKVAQNLAEERLPSVVARLRRGEQVDVSAEAPPLSVGRTVEVGRVADALTELQRTAVVSAVGEASLRQGINRVFLNLAWRNQSLLHRQLRLLDAMERRADSDVLEDLFRLDHLTTRMRRHAEGLVILSGASPGRGWSRPLPMVDVLRAAVAEVEDYARVEVSTSEEISLIGNAAADVVHLLAELIENATLFSPPNTEVNVRGEPVGKGYAIEIMDRGIGIDEPERARLNQILSDPPEFDFADTDRLGLFVVARIAARRNIRVGLQESFYGGTTAIVLLPHALVVGALERSPEPVSLTGVGGPSGSGTDEVPLPSRHQRSDEIVQVTMAGGPPAQQPYEMPQQETPRYDAPPQSPPQPQYEVPQQPQYEAPQQPRYDTGRPEPAPYERWGLEPSAPAQEPAPPQSVGTTTSQEKPVLTRRRRMENLAPQLRESALRSRGTARESGPSWAEEPREPAERPAEETRDLWGAIQGGWERGRDQPGREDETGNARTDAPGEGTP
ncbi:nitrate- and nitrite sensing domain-containing protein [Spirillospora sp. NPDC047279]|uniref:sensor histidine kinase n=1 Tax=Spirillospora sp. NPDC047279 TaxID=3155478 RepID=UPI0033DCA558